MYPWFWRVDPVDPNFYTRMIILFESFLEPGCNSSKILTPPLRYPPFEAKVVQNAEIWGEKR